MVLQPRGSGVGDIHLRAIMVLKGFTSCRLLVLQVHAAPKRLRRF